MSLHYEDIDELIKEIRAAHQDKMVGSIARIDFNDYSIFKKYLYEKLEDIIDEIKIEFNFLGIEINFRRNSNDE